MKRFLALVFAVLLLLPSAVAADVILEPENGFFAVGYHSVRDEFEMLESDPVSLVVV